MRSLTAKEIVYNRLYFELRRFFAKAQNTQLSCQLDKLVIKPKGTANPANCYL